MECYADYEYYMTEYGGRSIPEEAFQSAMLKASAFLNRITYGRITEPYRDEVRCAACELAEMQHLYEQKHAGGTGEVKSENTDGYAVAYVTEGVDGETQESLLRRKMFAAARVWLGNTGLLYLGVND